MQEIAEEYIEQGEEEGRHKLNAQKVVNYDNRIWEKYAIDNENADLRGSRRDAIQNIKYYNNATEGQETNL